MSIKSTRTISRDEAIERITYITGLALTKNYRALERTTSEHEREVQDFVSEAVDFSDLTNRMLEDVMDQPFYRYSMFDNYFVED